MDPGFYWWLIIMVNIGVLVCTGTLAREISNTRSISPWGIASSIGALLGLACILYLLREFPWIALGWERKAALVACSFLGVICGRLLITRQDNEGGYSVP